jgi:hypothetical protein
MKTMYITYTQAGGRGNRGQGRAEEVEGLFLKKKFITKTRHTYVINIPTTESLGPRLEWAQIQSQNLRSICGFWTRLTLGLNQTPSQPLEK